MLNRSIITITLFAILLTTLVSFAVPVSAGDPIKFKPAVPIPGMKIPAEGIDITPTTVGEYIKTIYTFSVYAGSILAVVVLMIGGFIWLTAGGNVSQVGQARAYIGGAISGFVLLLLSWTILQMVNPALVEFKPIVVQPIDRRINLEVTTPFCCVCTKGGSAPASSNKCPDIRIEIGTCSCPGSKVYNGVTRRDCQAFDPACMFNPGTIDEHRAKAVPECESFEAQGFFCDLATNPGRCAENALCQASLAAAGTIGSCTENDECKGGAICNHAWQCTLTDAIGSPTTTGQKVPLAGRGCCKPLGYVNDTCVRDSDCNSSLHCQGGYEGDASLWRLITGGNYVNPPVVGVCK